MTAEQILKANAAIDALMSTEIDWQDSYALIKLKRRLREEAEIFSEQERKLIDKYADKDESGNIKIENGRFRVSGDNAQKFMDERDKLCKVQVEWNEKRPALHIEKIKPVIMEALTEFIDFI